MESAAPDRGRLLARIIRIASILLGAVSLLAFFAPRGSFSVLRPRYAPLQAIVWDALLSLVFFLQHSLMIRKSVRGRLERLVRPELFMAVYSILSAVALLGFVLFWRSSGTTAWQVTGVFEWVVRGLLLIPVAGFAWGVLSLTPFDPFGVLPISRWLRGRKTPAPLFSIKGPYRWVRHPLYLCMLALIWLDPRPTLESVACNVLWTLWIVLGTVWEEKDLVADFPDSYRRYQKQVPMLVPWRGPLFDRGSRSRSLGKA